MADSIEPGSIEPGRVCILMGMYNGAADLPEQLQSLADQTWPVWDLIVSDDASRDEGPQIVRDFAHKVAPAGCRVSLVNGPGRGFAANFLSLVAQIPDDASWMAFSDQDDVWLPDRLSRGIAALEALEGNSPALYCSRTWITDARLENRRLSALIRQPPGFSNALVQNIAAGNTILLNAAALALVRAAAPGTADIEGIAAHDWWVYQVITGAGGVVICDPEPTLLYRQHDDNLIGANDGWRAQLWRFGMLLRGRFTEWNSANIAALNDPAVQLTPENRALLNRFAGMRAKWFWPRLRAFMGLGLYRQGRIGQATLWLAVLLNKI